MAPLRCDDCPRMTESSYIRFNRPTVAGNELAYVQEALKGGHTAAAGPFSARAAELLRAWFDTESVVLTTSCTDALELAALLIDVEPGDEVIVPSFTFVSTALAFARAGATLVFADIESEYLALDPVHVKSLVSERTKAIVTVHYAGVGGYIEELQNLTGDGIDLIEDNAHGLFGQTRGQKLGTLGRFSTLSFHETKNFSCGEGGALVVNDPRDRQRAQVLADKGTNRQAFLEGEVDKYSWQDIGSSFGLSDMLAAFLLGQLEQREQRQARRKSIFDSYMTALAPLVSHTGIRLPRIPQDCVPAYHMFYVLLPDVASRNEALRSLRAQGVNATFHYVPLHSSRGGRQFSEKDQNLPITDDISGRLLRLPLHNALTDDEINRVVDAATLVIEQVT